MSRLVIEWLESLELFGMQLGLERMTALLERLEHPERAYPAIHVVGTNGKTTVARMVEALLVAEGLSTGVYTSPHVVSWSERIRVNGEEADFQRAIERVRVDAEAVGATQFEVVTAAALEEFSQAAVDVAVVEAGLGGRLDATNVLEAPVVVLTNVSLEHTEHLGPTREEIAREKLAVVAPGAGATVVLGEPEWDALAGAQGAGRVVAVSHSNLGVAVTAAQEFLGRPVDPRPAENVVLPGRLERRGEEPLEIWDGAHNLAGVGYLLGRLPRRDWTLVLSILADKDAERMLAAFSPLGGRLVATTSGHPRALAPEDLAGLAQPFFAEVAIVADPLDALTLAREAAGPEGAVLVSGSLYLLAALAAVRTPGVR